MEKEKEERPKETPKEPVVMAEEASDSTSVNEEQTDLIRTEKLNIPEQPHIPEHLLQNSERMDESQEDLPEDPEITEKEDPHEPTVISMEIFF